MNVESLQSCMDACISCALECEHCVTESLRGNQTETRSKCIALCRESAVICRSAAVLMSISGPHATLLCEACINICRECADECDKYELMHSRHCADECRTCADECERMSSEVKLSLLRDKEILKA